MLQRLEEEGIKAYLQDEHTVTIDPILTNAIGGIKLMVYKNQVGRAMELLNGFEETYKNSFTCTVCGSTNIEPIVQPDNKGNWFTGLASWFFGNLAVSGKKQYTCNDCGHEAELIE
jgi:hypothetical protein